MRSLACIFSLFVILSLATSKVEAQFSISIYSGYARSDFELQNESVPAIPFGITAAINITPKFETGLEFCTLLKAFEQKEMLYFDYYGNPIVLEGSTYQITQNNIGIYAKYFLLMDNFYPYLKAGVAYYTGERSYVDGQIGQENYEFKGAIGYYPAIGVKSSLGLYLEFLYHFVQRKYDYEGAKFYKYNNWIIVLGYSHSI